MARDSVEVVRMKGAKAAFGDKREAAFGKAAAAAPFTLRSLGLGSGVAALAAKGDEHQKIAEMIARWLVEGDNHFTLPEVQGKRDSDQINELMRRIAHCSRTDYRKAQIEAMGYVGWIKKLAQAFCPKEES